ncbi:MAG: glycosyltransferase [Thermofilum sp.]
MKISVVVASYCRAWALGYCLESLRQQLRPADEVVLVLKSCGDESELVVRKYEAVLPVKLIRQSSGGNCADAYELGIRNAMGDLILFIDDDAIAERDWVLRYERFFNETPDAGAAGGLTFKAYLDADKAVVKTREPFCEKKTRELGPHRKPMKGLEEYCAWISSAGFMGNRKCDESGLSLDIGGANMGFRAALLKDFPLAQLFKNSRRCYSFEQILAYNAIRKGYKVYVVNDVNKAPIVWHIMHRKSLSRGEGFWDEFWLHYDRVAMFWRLKKLGAPLSLPRYLLGLAILMRKKTIPRLLATMYGLLFK